MREAEISADGETVAISGDSTNATLIEVFAPKSVKMISWNGKALLKAAKTSYGSLTASGSGLAASFSPPELGPRKVQDSLPERFTSYNDSDPAWVDTNHMTTPNPSPPDTLPVLYVDEYGFHQSVHLWRGYFTGDGTGVFLNLQGGTAFG